jgi:hypothetical protein
LSAWLGSSGSTRNAGVKSQMYKHNSLVDNELLSFFKEKGNPINRKIRKSKLDAIEMSEAQLRKYLKSDNSEEREKAKKILKIIRSCRSNLMDDEVAIAKELGIRTAIDIPSIVFNQKSQRFSIQWRARTRRIEDAIRFVLLAPRDDTIKRNKSKQVLQRMLDKTKQITEKLKSEGYEPWDWQGEGNL